MEEKSLEQEIEQENTLITKDYLTEMSRQRLAKILYHLTITAGIMAPSVLLLILLGSTMGGMFYMVVFFVAILVSMVLIVCTLGLIFFEESNFLGKMWEFIGSFSNVSEKMFDMIGICFEIANYVSFVGIGIGALTIVVLSFTKKKGKVKNIVWSSILTGLMVLYIIIFFVGGALGIW